jgi:hypothetical protein
MSSSHRPVDFDAAAAVTRSLLGWGVVAGAFYLIVGLAQALTRDGFDLGRHPLSLLMLGEGGWMQRANLLLSGLMVVAAALGFSRAMGRAGAVKRAGILLGVFGLGLIGSGIFPPDPMAGFPPDADQGTGTIGGVLHLALGAIGFLCLSMAAFPVARWFGVAGSHRLAGFSRIGGVVILLGFIGGAALSNSPAGIVGLWCAVVAGWAWLAMASVGLYRTVPHPDAHRRDEITQVEDKSRS